MQAWPLMMLRQTARWQISLVSPFLNSYYAKHLIHSTQTASIVSEWPWWKDFHSFWRELPNYNPIGVTTSTPGVDHASQAAALFESAEHGDVDDTPTTADGETLGVFGEELAGDSEIEVEEVGAEGIQGKELDELSLVRGPNFFCGLLWSNTVIFSGLLHPLLLFPLRSPHQSQPK